jgi:hypothetical protein
MEIKDNKMRSRGGDKRGKYQLWVTKRKFIDLLYHSYTDKQIMNELGLKRRTYYRYKSIILEEERLLWKRIMSGHHS